MDTRNQETKPQETNGNPEAGVALTLIGMGALFLLARFVDIGWLVMPLLASGFLVAGVLTRSAGWFIPSGILAGLSLGIYLIDGPSAIVSGDAEGGVFLLAFAAGWLSITILTTLFTRAPMRWPLIPAAIMGLVGAAVLIGERGQWALEQIFAVFNYLWPLGLVAIGIAMLLRHRRVHAEQPK